MIHPSYTELIDTINERSAGEEPVIRSRYSLVAAAAKRARQLIAGAEETVEAQENEKALSIAIDELYAGTVNIVPEEAAEPETDDLITEAELQAEIPAEDAEE